MEQINPTTVATAATVQTCSQVGRKPMKDYVATQKAKIEALRERITQTQNLTQISRLRAQIQAAQQRMKKRIQEEKEEEHLKGILCFFPFEKRDAIRAAFFDLSVSDDVFKDIVEK